MPLQKKYKADFTITKTKKEGSCFIAASSQVLKMCECATDFQEIHHVHVPLLKLQGPVLFFRSNPVIYPAEQQWSAA